jgi:hypothetical protein
MVSIVVCTSLLLLCTDEPFHVGHANPSPPFDRWYFHIPNEPLNTSSTVPLLTKEGASTQVALKSVQEYLDLSLVCGL